MTEEKKSTHAGRKVTRRGAIKAAGAAGLGAVLGAASSRSGFAQTKAPIRVGFWTFENPQQRPWIHKRVKLYMEQNPHVTVDFQWFTFGDLGKKISVGFATGTAPDGFVSQDWFMPTWLDKGLLAPLDVQRLGYSSHDAFTNDFTSAFVKGATQDGKVYGYPLWFYGFCNYINTRQFKEVGLDPDKDWPKDWKQFGEVAKRLTIRDGNRFTRQGFKFAMHAAQWTMIQFNPILITHGGQWFDASGKCTVNDEAGVKAMIARASIAKQYGAEDPADFDRHQSAAADGLAQGALLDVLVSPHPAGCHQVAEPGDVGSRLLPAGPVSRRRTRQGDFHDLRIQSRRQRARTERKAGDFAGSLQVHHERPRRLLEGHRTLYAGAQKRMDR